MQKLSKRTLAPRASGKLPRGPVTPADLLRASANSTRHGMLAENLVLDDESKDLFALLHQQFIDRLNPTDGIEICLVEELASTVWRQRRLVAIETHLFKEAAAKRQEQTYLGRIGGAFSDLCQTPEIHLLDRYESRLHRMFQRSLKNLELLRQIEYTDPSTGELTQLPVEVTGIPDAPADPATPDLPNEPSCEQPHVESTTSPTTSVANPEPDINAEGRADFGLLPTGSQVPPSPPTNQLPNEPRSEQPAAESTTSHTTSVANPEPGINAEGGAGFSLLPTGPKVPLHPPPQVPPSPSIPEIHELPNEPRSAQRPAESTTHPTTSNAKSVRHWSDTIDPITGRLRDVA